jgi:hypothetical protein
MIRMYFKKFVTVPGMIADAKPSARRWPDNSPADRPAQARTAEADNHAAQSTHRRAEA